MNITDYVALWINNDQSLYFNAQEIVRRYSDPVTAIEEWFLELCFDGIGLLAKDILECCLSDVDWSSIVDYLTEE